jgi:transposase
MHALCDGKGRPLIILPFYGQMSDCKGVILLSHTMLMAKAMTVDKGYDGDWLLQTLATCKTTACIPFNSNRKV